MKRATGSTVYGKAMTPETRLPGESVAGTRYDRNCANLPKEPKLRTIPERIGARLSAAAIGNVFKSVARHIKMPAEEIQAISGHSVRVGATQDLLALIIDLASVMQAGRWKSHRMPMRYGEHVMAARGGMARAAKEQGRDRE